MARRWSRVRSVSPSSAISTVSSPDGCGTAVSAGSSAPPTVFMSAAERANQPHESKLGAIAVAFCRARTHTVTVSQRGRGGEASARRQCGVTTRGVRYLEADAADAKALVEAAVAKERAKLEAQKKAAGIKDPAPVELPVVAAIKGGAGKTAKETMTNLAAAIRAGND